MTIVMGLDQHRAQITAEWLDTDTGEISRKRIAPADRDGVRAFTAGPSTGRGCFEAAQCARRPGSAPRARPRRSALAQAQLPHISARQPG